MNLFKRLLLVFRHAWAMWRVLNAPKNRAKGDWRNNDPSDLLSLLDREREELFVACWELERGKGPAQRVKEEAADVSAFAAMVADVARKKSTS